MRVTQVLDEPGILTAVEAHPDVCAEVMWGKRLAAVRVTSWLVAGEGGDACKLVVEVCPAITVPVTVFVALLRSYSIWSV